jgi:hypothetical protein
MTRALSSVDAILTSEPVHGARLRSTQAHDIGSAIT